MSFNFVKIRGVEVDDLFPGLLLAGLGTEARLGLQSGASLNSWEDLA